MRVLLTLSLMTLGQTALAHAGHMTQNGGHSHLGLGVAVCMILLAGIIAVRRTSARS